MQFSLEIPSYYMIASAVDLASLPYHSDLRIALPDVAVNTTITRYMYMYNGTI